MPVVAQSQAQLENPIAVLAWVQYSFDLSPNLSPKRREALNLTPLPFKGRGWGLGLYSMQLGTAINPPLQNSITLVLASTRSSARASLRITYSPLGMKTA
jgi:hypothetical protein